ncbi:MAG: RluA family pseudouridine synthase [Lachnospiraceae bacterium]|nr:RluA family pseudouridine synthase [Lachnospiraceae bacterium]
MKELRIASMEAGQRLDKYLNKLLPGAGMSFLYKMLRKKNITLNGKKAEGKEILSEEDVVKIFFSDETFAAFCENGKGSQKKNAPLKKEPSFFAELDQGILYETADLLIVNKPAGVLTQKADGKDVSVNDWALARIPDSAGFKPSVLNRLDRNTSGIVLISKSIKGAQVVSQALKERTIGKYYRTLVFGSDVPEGIHRGYLKKNARTNQVKISATGEGDPIETGISCIKQGFWKQIPVSYLEIHLITGKSHQIRAHLASLGHPILGDPKYGSRKVNETLKAECSVQNQLLHAYRVEAGEAILGGFIVEAPIPPSFDRILKKIL